MIPKDAMRAAVLVIRINRLGYLPQGEGANPIPYNHIKIRIQWFAPCVEVCKLI